MSGVEDPLVKWHRENPGKEVVPQEIFSERAELGFCNSPYGWALAKKQKLRVKRGESVMVDLPNGLQVERRIRK